jgi:hypothetical protein
MSDYSKLVFPIIKREPIPDPYAGERCCYEPGICMREACGLPRKDNSVLCEEHTQEVLDKKAKAPPLIPYPLRDYQSSARRTFIVEELPDLELIKKT